MTPQQKIVSERLTYHFLLTTGEWDIPPGMPFMKEFLNEVKKLCESDQPGPVSVGKKTAEKIMEEYGFFSSEETMQTVLSMMEEYAEQFRSAPSIPFLEPGYSYKTLINLVDSLKEYTRESQSILGNDGREADEFVKIFLSMNNRVVMFPSREEAEREAEKYALEIIPNEEPRDPVRGIIQDGYRKNIINGFLACYDWLLPQIWQPGDRWISVKKRLPVKEDTCDEFHNEILTLQHGRTKPTLMKYWEIKDCPFTHHWMPLPSSPKQ